MTVRNDHPDELIHRLRRGGSVSPRERSLVDRHLRLCAVCRFLELTARAYDREGETVLDGVDLDAMVAKTIENLPRPDAWIGRGAAPGRSGGRFSSRAAVRASTGFAVLLLFGGAAMAAFIVARRAPPLPEKPVISVVAPAAPPRLRRAVREPVGVTPPGATVPAPAPSIDVPVQAPPPRSRLASSRVVALRSRATAASSAARQPTAAELFVQANQARRDGRAADATAGYALLWTRFPTSEEARTSRAIVGRWLLDRGAYGDAVSAFHDYLRVSSGGVLEEEVLVGLATALERLGRGAQAASTWQQLLAEHPSTAHASRARIHLGRLRAAGQEGDPRP
jgi:hypothetical protein